MRIISGKYRGLEIKGYNIIGTRPTMDRVKESLFAMIQSYLKESICLDLFAGSGSLGIEALSQGANECYFIDSNKVVIKTLEDNLNRLKVNEKYHLLCDDFISALNKFRGNKKFDIIFLDPPYDLNLINKCIELITDYDLLSDRGIVICEYEKENIRSQLEIIKQKSYGDKKIMILKNNG